VLRIFQVPAQPNDPNAIGDLDNVFGVKMLPTTKIAAGTALMLDVLYQSVQNQSLWHAPLSSIDPER
jgi:hypothetical protein